jgi:hypothetical protein
MTGAACLRNQKGNLSGPGAVGRRWSRRWNTENSEIELSEDIAEDLRDGGR